MCCRFSHSIVQLTKGCKSIHSPTPEGLFQTVKMHIWYNQGFCVWNVNMLLTALSPPDSVAAPVGCFDLQVALCNKQRNFTWVQLQRVTGGTNFWNYLWCKPLPKMNIGHCVHCACLWTLELALSRHRIKNSQNRQTGWPGQKRFNSGEASCNCCKSCFFIKIWCYTRTYYMYTVS